MTRLTAVVLALLALLAATASARPPTVRALSLPRSAVVGVPWRAAVSVKPQTRATLEARGSRVLRVTLSPKGKNGVARASLRFTSAGRWAVSVVAGGRRTRLGSVDVDVPRDPLILDPIAIAAEPSGSLVVGQLREAGLLRLADGRATTVASGPGFFQVTVVNGVVYGAGRDGAVYRLDGSTLTRITPPLDASSVAVDTAGNLYITVYVGWVKRVAPDGTVTTIAGNGTEGYSGDGGPATAAQIFHPHAIVVGRDGALYVADTENRRIRRIDLTTGRITTLGGDVGITVSLAVAPDGSILSADVVRAGSGGGVTRTTPDGATTRLVAASTANGVAVAPDGTVYVNLWEDRRIQRLNPSTGRLEPIARG